LEGVAARPAVTWKIVERLDASLGGDAPDLQRRALLAGLMAACFSSYVPRAVAQPAADPAQDAFLAVSRILTGRTSLDLALAGRLYEALLADMPRFGEDVQALRAWMDEREIGPDELQRRLDAEKSPLAGLPREIVTAWYTGIVGHGERARCIAFETSLIYVIVADRLRPPSYCYGPPGSWVEQPA